MPLHRHLPRVLCAALLAAVVLLAPAVSMGRGLLVGARAQTVQASHAPSAPALPQAPDAEHPVTMDLVSLTPTSLSEDGVLEATVEVTNTSSQPVHDPVLELRTRTPRVTDRTLLMTWQANPAPDDRGVPVAVSPPTGDLAPGQSRRLTVSASAKELGYTPEPYYWGTRRISLTLRGDDRPLGGLRTFTVWRPTGADTSIAESVLLPLAAEDPSMAASSPERSAGSMRDGALARLRTVAEHPAVDWWLDPSLLDPPLLPVRSGQPSDGGGAKTAPRYARDPEAERYAKALAAAAGERTVMRAPYDRADLVSLGQAGATDLRSALSAASTQALQRTGVTAGTLLVGLPTAQASPQAVRELRDAGADALILSSSSLRQDPIGTVTPSSAGTIVDGDRRLPVLAPDPELSVAFSEISTSKDPELAIASLLAQTATIASEQVTGPRHVLIAPSLREKLNTEAVGSALSALQKAPWLTQEPTAALLDAARDSAWARSTTDDSGALYGLGNVPISSVQPTGPDDNGRFVPRKRASSEPLLDARALQTAQKEWQRAAALGATMDDDAELEETRHLLLSATSKQWRGDASRIRERTVRARTALDDLHGRIRVVPASSYNVISDAPQVPVTIANGLDTAVTVRPRVSVDRPLVKITQVDEVTIPARGHAEVSVPMEAIANGSVTMHVQLRTADGAVVGRPGRAELSVNPAWENWTTMLLVIAMSVLVVVGVLRARRTGSDTRAPAELGPEAPLAPETSTERDRSGPAEEN